MKVGATTTLVGVGDPSSELSVEQLRYVVTRALAGIRPAARVLAIIPDKTRDDNTHCLFPLAAAALAAKNIAQLDALIAQGTHPAMSDNEKRAKIGAVDGTAVPGLGRVLDHRWDEPQELATIGTLAADRVRELSGGLLDQAIPLRINRLLSPGLYDTVLIFGATMPHEVAGFGGGAKYFFPGVAGPELTHATHWLGALAGIEKIIGRIETPVRRLIEAAADFVSARVICFTSVASRAAGGRLRTHALFAGDCREALRRGAEVSRHVHIRYTGRKYRRVVALLDEHYDDLWVGGKASYRLGAVIEDGGELLVYAPHLRTVSEAHGRLIERFGYAPLEMVKQLVGTHPDLQQNLCVAAHLAHVAYGSRIDPNGGIVPRYRITLATGLDEATCRRLKLGYADYRRHSPADYASDPDTLIVERAGQELYLVSAE